MTIIEHGTLITPEGPLDASLGMSGGKIAAIGKLVPGPGDETVDASGCLVFPGFIDGHTHLDLEVSNTVTADDFESGTRAAVCGGTTTVVDFATQDTGGTLKDALARWHGKAAGKMHANVAFHMAVTDWNEQTKAEIADMKEAGVTSFKVYLAYDFRVRDDELLDILRTVKEAGGIVGVHCENGALVDRLRAEMIAAGRTGTEAHPKSRPPETEAEAVGRVCWIARMADAPVHIVHLSTKAGLEEVLRARARGQKVYAETCPQYLLFDDSVYDLPDFEGAKYVMSPPLRKKEDTEALTEAVLAGQIDTIATDHCSFFFDGQKTAGRNDFTKIPNGAPGLEHRPSVMLDAFSGRLTPEALCRLLSENPARLFGLYPHKGVLRTGADADVVIWDPAAEWSITAAEQQQNVDYTPYEGRKIRGRARQVYVGGRLAAENGRPAEKLCGTYVPRYTAAVFE